MNEKEYIKRVAGKLNCSGKRREEIRRQLASDIAAARENGESPADIFARMGTPEEVAADFNANFSDAERKAGRARRRNRVLAAAGIVFAVFVVWVYWAFPKQQKLGASGLFTEEEVREKAGQAVEWIAADDFDSVYRNAAPVVQKALGEDYRAALAGVKAQIGADWGEIVSYGSAYTAEVTQKGRHSAVIQINVSFENAGVTFRFSFDEEMRMDGLYMW